LTPRTLAAARFWVAATTAAFNVLTDLHNAWLVYDNALCSPPMKWIDDFMFTNPTLLRNRLFVIPIWPQF
jgi:hypothetical protein